MKRILLAILILLIGLAPASADVSWRTMRTTHFIIYYSADDASTATRAGEVAEKWHAILSRKLEFESAAITPLHLYPDRQSFADATGYEPGENITGVAHISTRVVRVDATGAFEDIEHIIPHELVHVFLSRMLTLSIGRLPLWMNEGLAKYLSHDWSGRDAELLADAASGGEIMPLQQLVREFPTDEHLRSVAYVESYSAVRYIAEKYGFQALLDILSEMPKQPTFDKAFFYSVGQEPKEFDEEWRAFLWDKYSLARWGRMLSGLAWAVMALLVVFAFRARILKKRRRARELELEESGIHPDGREWTESRRRLLSRRRRRPPSDAGEDEA